MTAKFDRAVKHMLAKGYKADKAQAIAESVFKTKSKKKSSGKTNGKSK